MKKSLIVLLTLLVLACQSGPQKAQIAKAPLDPQVRTGILSNGLTYFILKNAKPETRASLRLAIKAGSIQEAEAQRGLAHFVEHMAFNGSEHFSKNALVNYFESIGMDFGHDLNAYTSFEETVYMLEIPTDKPEITDQSLTVLKDWLQGLSFDPTEVDKERGVVQEEWRLSLGADNRRFETQWPLMSGGSLYSDRLPIGKMEVIRTAPAKDLKDFYTKWYTPSHAAIIAVGDFDPEELEKKIQLKFAFGDTDQPETPILPNLPLPKGRTVQLFSDPELSYNLIQVLRVKKNLDLDYRNSVKKALLDSLGSSALNTRLADLARGAKPPFIQAQISFDAFISDTIGLTLSVIPGINQYLPALEAAILEVQKIRTAGFTPRETQREKASFLSSFEQAYTQRFDAKSPDKARGLLNHFLKNEPFPSDDFEYQTYKSVLEEITPQDLSRNLSAWFEGDDEVVLVSGPASSDNNIPKEAQIEDVILKARTKAFTPEPEVSIKNLMDKIPEPGKILKETKLEASGVLKWELSNGAVVYLKTTDFKAEEILFQGLSRGGSSLVSDQDYLNAQLGPTMVSGAGVGKLTQQELNDALSDKQVQVNLSVEDAAETISGSSSLKDLETFFQLLNLKMTSVRKDPVAYESLLSRIKDNLTNRLQDPQQVFSDEIQRVLTGDNFRGKPMTPQRLTELNLDRILDIYNKRFSNGGDFTFFFVGDVKPEVLKPLVETYLASLPSLGKETAKDLGIRPFKPPFQSQINKGMEPRSQVVLLFPNEGILDPADLVAMDALKDVLSIRLREAIREERGGTYGVQAGFSYRREPYGALRYFISFGCAPDRVAELEAASLVEMEKLRQGIFKPEDMEKIKEIRRRNLETSLKTNGFWLGQMISYLYTIQNPDKMMDFSGRIERLSPEILTPLAKKYMDPKTMLQLILTQEK